MMKRIQTIGFIALVAILVFSMAACDNGSTKALKKIFRGVVSGNLDIYELVIDSKEPAAGDDYELYLYDKSGEIKGESSGTINSISGTSYSLSNGTSVVATITDEGMTGIKGTITTTRGTIPENETLTPVKDGGNGALNGTWKKGDETVTFKGSNFTYKGEVNAPGTAYYSPSPGILVTSGTYKKEFWMVAGNYTLTGNTITFSGFNGIVEYNGDWVKQ